MAGSTGGGITNSFMPQNSLSNYANSSALRGSAPQPQSSMTMNSRSMQGIPAPTYSQPAYSQSPMANPMSNQSAMYNPISSILARLSMGSVDNMGMGQQSPAYTSQPAPSYAPVDYRQMVSNMGRPQPMPSPMEPVGIPAALPGGTGGTSFDLGYQAPQADPAATGRGGITDLFSRAQIADRNSNRQMRRAR